MRNKWYVAGILVPAAALCWGAMHVLLNDGGVWAVVPAGLAAALVAAAVRVGQSESFAPGPPPTRLDDTGSPALERWKKHHANEDDGARL